MNKNLVTLDMTIEEIVNKFPKAADVLAQEGMECVTCVAASGETLSEAAEGHGIDPILLMRKLNLRLSM